MLQMLKKPYENNYGIFLKGQGFFYNVKHLSIKNDFIMFSWEW